ncbi:hypothetical protein DOTSEDRAFT_69743 [Dothistroma septosporum NZE10]|uniref:Uncharacterized protein n=1 Tax=Dothistroma septosporum (strain NZE10 / CBS 128990) TaxID=675120 RepID=N1Q097_DOTSN|nr:hypothetical protein DOTSEDRAFT_69743 [Dothistroma septosporum NZE10]
MSVASSTSSHCSRSTRIRRRLVATIIGSITDELTKGQRHGLWAATDYVLLINDHLMTMLDRDVCRETFNPRYCLPLRKP